MMRAASVTAALLLLAGLGCGRPEARALSAAAPAAAKAATPSSRPGLAPRAPRALTAQHLPEDPVAGARSTEQWRQRRASRLRTRQLIFDRDHMADHRALLEQIADVRTRYDRARSEAALSAARASAPAQLEKMKARVREHLDTGRGSRLLEDYAALHAALTASYPDAKLASLRGDASALTAATASFDQRLQAMHAWLDEAKSALAEGEAPRPQELSRLSKASL